MSKIKDCPKCHKGKMKFGKALRNTLTWGNDFGGEADLDKPPSGVTISENGPPVMVNCLKCTKCGFSIGKNHLLKTGKKL